MKTFALLFLIVTAPAITFAQATIAGAVSDSSGAALTAVIVEARSPELIENVRRTVTDDSGRYRIENLRPGRYTVRFTRDGWSVYQREDVELSGSFTAIIDASLTLALAQTVTVTSDLPLIDVHGVSRETTFSSDLIRSLPATRGYNALVVLIPGVVTTFNDVVTETATTSFPIHGGRAAESRLFVDGLNVGSPPSGNSATSYVLDAGLAREVTFTATGALGESETGGLIVNVVPRSGGNTRHASVLASASGTRLQSDNLTPDLKAQGAMATRRWSKSTTSRGSSMAPSCAIACGMSSPAIAAEARARASTFSTTSTPETLPSGAMPPTSVGRRTPIDCSRMPAAV